MDIAKIDVIADEGPFAIHNMPCTVCRKRHAVLDLTCGLMRPCWECAALGWEVRKLGRFRLWWRNLVDQHYPF